MNQATGQGEFARGWRVLLGASFGVGLGIAGLLTYNLGLFTTDLGRVIGLSPSGYGAALLGLNIALALAMPLVGRAVDRFGSRATAALGAVLLAAGFCASLSSPVAHTRAVAQNFHRHRGLALGITQVGIGVAAAAVPPLVAWQIARGGWQSGFVLLAGLAAAGLIPALLGLPGRSEVPRESTAGAPPPALWASGIFRLQLAAFTLMAFAFVGIIAHFVPMLRASGLSIERAGALAGAIGMSVIVTRLIVGWLADRVEPAWLGAASCLVCAVGAIGLAEGGLALALPAALALGCAIGAEADLIGILTARNFPLASYSRAYSTQYAAFTLAAGASPLGVGLLVEATGGYRAPLWVCAVLLIAPIALFILLARRVAKEPS
jgi:cyanate permease